VNTVDLSVIVVTHQGGELATTALRAARERTGTITAEWLVVDSGSTDGTPEVLEAAFPDVRVERLPNVGFAAGNNVALERARGRYLLLLNPDMEIASGTLADLVAAMDARPEVGLASVIQTWPDGGLQQTIRRFPSPSRQLGEALWLTRLPGLARLSEEEHRPEPYGREQAADWLVGGFMLVRRETIEEVGGLDERFFLFSEETDWCRRVRDAGWEIRHLPLVTAIHHTGRMARPDLFAQNSHSKLLYARKHLGRGGGAAFRAALAVRHALRVGAFAPLGLLRPPLRVRLQAEARALAVVTGVSAPPYRPYRPVDH
jgi:N-acetylglucosaminyl-diphospho-decaprenol L-rhamnosyltransferase